MNRRMAVYVLLALTVLMIVDGRYELFNTSVLYRYLIRVEETEGAGLDPGTPTAERSGLVDKTLGPGEVLEVSNAFGNIYVDGASHGREARLTYTIYVYASSETEAEAYLSELDVEVVQSADGLRVSVVAPKERPAEIRQVRVDISGSIPSDARVDISNAMGRVRVQGVSGPSRVSNAFNDTNIKNIHGNLHIDAAYTNLDVNDVQGDVAVRGNYGSSSLRDIRGDIFIKSDFRTTSVMDVIGDIEAETSFGGVEVKEIEGDLKARGSYIVIGAKNLTGSVLAASEYGTVRLQGIGGDTVVDAKRSDVSIVIDGPLDHRISLETHNGTLALRGTLSSLQLTAAEDGKKALSEVVGAGTHSIDVKNVQGNISVTHPPHP